MSNSQNFGGGSRDLRYQNRRCFCNNKAKIKVVESEKPSKGMLYYVCETGACSFWAWCNPISREGGTNESSCQNPYVEGVSPIGPATAKRFIMSGQGIESNNYNIIMGLQSKIHNVEATMGLMKMMMMLTVLVSLLSLVVICMRWILGKKCNVWLFGRVIESGVGKL